MFGRFVADSRIDKEEIVLSDIKMDLVFTHYQIRLAAHKELVRHFEAENISAYTELALGIARPEGNYSASEHHLGPQVGSSTFQVG